MAKSKPKEHKIFAAIHEAAKATSDQGANKPAEWRAYERKTKNFKRSDTTISGHSLSIDANALKAHELTCQAYLRAVNALTDAFRELTISLRPPLTSATTESESEA